MFQVREGLKSELSDFVKIFILCISIEHITFPGEHKVHEFRCHTPPSELNKAA